MTDTSNDQNESSVRRGEGAVVVAIILGCLALLAMPMLSALPFIIGVAGVILSLYGLRLTKGHRYPVARWVALALPCAALIGLIGLTIVRNSL